jgi:uncharacterized membrane protein YhaH (DUF805 family)
MTTTTSPMSTSTMNPAATYPAPAYSAPTNPAAAQSPSQYWPPESTNRSARLDQTRYWVGAALTAVIAALIGLVGLTVAHGILHVPVLFASGSTLAPVHYAVYGLAAAAIALVASGIYDAMVHVAPRPAAYYGWLAGIVTLLAGLLPFTTAAGLHSQFALGLTNLAVGVAIAVLVPLAATNARR